MRKKLYASEMIVGPNDNILNIFNYKMLFFILHLNEKKELKIILCYKKYKILKRVNFKVNNDI